jgi:hypothetical protein
MMDDPHANLEVLFQTYIFFRREEEGAQAAGDKEAEAILSKKLNREGNEILRRVRRDLKWNERG